MAVVVCVAACSGGSGGSTSPTPTTSKTTPTPTPTFTQLGTLVISAVLGVQASESGGPCPTAAEAFPDNHDPNAYVACDSRRRQALLLAEPALNEREIDATTTAKQPGGNWTVFLQLSRRGARAAQELSGARYAIVYDGVVVSVSSGTPAGGFVQINDLSKHKANRIAANLNPS